MKPAADGSITIYIQAESPGKGKESNWLPTPKEPFYMLFRMYQPDIEVRTDETNFPYEQIEIGRTPPITRMARIKKDESGVDISSIDSYLCYW